MATTLDALPRELAHWSLAAAAHHHGHGHPTTTTTTTATGTTTMPMTPPHTDRLHGRWVEQQPQTHTNYNNNNNTNFLHGHGHTLNASAHLNARHGQLLTPPDDTPPLDVPMDAAYEPPLALAPAFASHPHAQRAPPPPPPHRADDERRRGNIEFEIENADLKQEQEQQQDDAPLAWAHDWLHVSRARPESAALVAEKTCEMICYLWFAPSPSPSKDASASLREDGVQGGVGEGGMGGGGGIGAGGRTTPSALQLTASPTFVAFTQKLLETTQVSQSVIVLALHYIHRLRARNAATPAQPGSEFRVAVAGLMMANKFLDDNTYTNATWAAVSLIPLPQINTMEREFLLGCDYNLYVSAKVYGDWGRLLRGLVGARARAGRPHSSHTQVHQERHQRGGRERGARLHDVGRSGGARRTTTTGAIAPHPRLGLGMGLGLGAGVRAGLGRRRSVSPTPAPGTRGRTVYSVAVAGSFLLLLLLRLLLCRQRRIPTSTTRSSKDKGKGKDKASTSGPHRRSSSRISRRRPIRTRTPTRPPLPPPRRRRPRRTPPRPIRTPPPLPRRRGTRRRRTLRTSTSRRAR
ncbi:hypothetical protein B0H11DRAFT_119738 [Mycena galericulata]|nr:hypothetical protein B0H11DRAFT_119738 [Mycena galericulata]